ncbi:MAG: helix-hairpin-helix domain-containing protein [Bryobacteraceae bacterium]
MPDGAGKETTQRVCGSCHAAELVTNRRESREGWSGVIEDMIRRGTKATDDELGEVADYLVANFSKSTPLPPVNVNKAGAGELAIVLGISDEKAAAIVKHREGNGDFKTLEDLQKVPGLEARIVDAKKKRLVF